LNKRLRDDLVDASVLGKWKLEKEVFLIIALAPKLYMLVDSKTNEVTFKAKGIKLSFLNPMVYIKLAQSIYDNDICGVIDIDCGELFRRDMMGIYIESVRKNIRITNRRFIWRDGTTSPPFEVGKVIDDEEYDKSIKETMRLHNEEEKKITSEERVIKFHTDSSMKINLRPINYYERYLQRLQRSCHYNIIDDEDENSKIKAEVLENEARTKEDDDDNDIYDDKYFILIGQDDKCINVGENDMHDD